MDSGDFGCFSRVWSEAAEWARAGDIPKDEIQIFRQFHMINWLIQTALAKGHADWLVKERLISYEVGHTKPIEPWRILPPGTVGQYENSCVISTSLVITHFTEDFPWYKDDVYSTEFNLLSDDLRGRQAQDFGWPKDSFVYGPPVRFKFALIFYVLMLTILGLCD